MTEKLVKHIMHSGVIGCGPGTPLAEVVRILSDTDIHALVVTGDDGEVVGILSHMDVIPFHDQDLSQRTAGDVMTKKVISIVPSAKVSEAIKAMVENHIHRLVVTEEEDGKLKPVGVLSTTDIVREMRGSKWTWYL
ncbi:MAG: CBS domain-containing protein [Anaerolineae bacterium]|nr:CBS domain-containing protein [Anaerolineae bacterium]MCB0200413.1 CBS domain-containing protein [Anaerolineae bacterium]MCB0204687.1 CBS domain-containing protein [Anaerolineae bacterium]MCB0253789.1 CBS domain-containing protein [Anaerolineae bacterium]